MKKEIENIYNNMQNFKIVNIHTNKVINLNYTELQDFMSINRKDFFYNYTIQRIEKTNILKTWTRHKRTNSQMANELFSF